MKRSVPLVMVLVGLAMAGGCGGGTPADSDGTGGEGGADEGTGGAGDDEGTGGEAADGSGGEVADGSGATNSGSGASSGVGGNGGMGGGTGGSEFCEQYAAAACAWYEQCNGSECENWLGYQWVSEECADALVSIEQGFLEFHEDVAFGCIDAAEEAACNAGPPFVQASVKAACNGVFVGAVPLEGECAVSETIQMFDECAEGFCVRSAGPTGAIECLGTCTAYKTTGEECAGTDRCAEGLHCTGGECQPPVGVGEDCTERACEADLICAPASPTTCREPGEVGADCTDDYDCAGAAVCLNDECALDIEEDGHCRSDESCAEGNYCSYGDQECTPFLAADAICAGSDDRCEEGYTCSYDDPSTCVPTHGAEDEACGPWGCLDGLWCDETSVVGGVCAAKVGDGDACVGHQSCEDGLYCMDDSNCHAPGDLEDPCAASVVGSCLEGFCDRESGLCKAPRAEDETCNPLDPLDACQEGLYCACLADGCPAVSGGHEPEDVCVLRLNNGEFCTMNEECESGFCSSTLDECAEAPPENCSR